MALIIEHYNPDFGCTVSREELPPTETYYGVGLKGAHYLVSEQALLDGEKLGRNLIPSIAFRLVCEHEETQTVEVEEVPETMLVSIAVALKNKDPNLVSKLKFDRRRSDQPNSF